MIGPDARGVGWIFEYALTDETGHHTLAELRSRAQTARQGGSARYAEKLREQRKLPVRRRLELLLDPGFLAEALVQGGVRIKGLWEDELGLEEVFLRVTRGETQ